MTFFNPRTENQKFHLAYRDSENYLKRGKMVNRHLVFDNNRDNVSSIGENERVQQSYKLATGLEPRSWNTKNILISEIIFFFD